MAAVINLGEHDAQSTTMSTVSAPEELIEGERSWEKVSVRKLCPNLMEPILLASMLLPAVLVQLCVQYVPHKVRTCSCIHYMHTDSMAVGTPYHDVVVPAGLLATNGDSIEMEFSGFGCVQYNNVGLCIQHATGEERFEGLCRGYTQEYWHMQCHMTRVASTSMRIDMVGKNGEKVVFDNRRALHVALIDDVTFHLERYGTNATVKFSKATSYIQ